MPLPNYLPSNNYIGSSGYSTYGGSGSPTLATIPTYQDPLDYGVYDTATGIVKSIKTGKPWTGKEPRTGNTYTNGVAATGTGQGVQVPGTNTFINPNDPAQRYKPVDIVKSPDISAGEQNLLKTFTDSAANSLKDFNDYLKNFKSDLSSARTAAGAATDIGPTVAALQSQQQDYSRALGQDVQQLTAANAADAAAQRGIVGEARGLLPRYDEAVNRIGDYQQQQMANLVAKKHAGMGLSSDEEAQLAAGVAAVRLPLEQAKIGQAYNVLSNYALPVQRDIAGNLRSQITQFQPMVQGQQFTTAHGVTMDIQALKSQVANMTYQQALAFMQAQGVPVQVQQAILSGQIGQLGQIAALEDASRYRGLQDILSPVLSQPVNYSVGPTGPMAPARVPNYLGGVPGGNQPVSVGAPGANYNPTGYDPTTGRYTFNAGGSQGAPNYTPTGYDPNTGQYYFNGQTGPNTTTDPLSANFSPTAPTMVSPIPDYSFAG